MILINKKINIIFAGSEQFTVNNLNYLIKFNRFKIVCIFTKPDCKLNKINPVKKFAIKNNIKFFQPNNINNIYYYNIINNLNIDIIIVSSYGIILDKNILNIPKYGCINVHGSILPKWKGPAPIYWTILSGEQVSGITIIKMNEKIDNGDIIFQKYIKLKKNETYINLYNRLSKLSSYGLVFILNKILYNNLLPINKIFNIKLSKYYLIEKKYARKINKNDLEINLKEKNKNIYKKFKAFIEKKCFFYFKNIKINIIKYKLINKNKNLIEKNIFIKNKKIYIKTLDGFLVLTKIQFINKKPIYVSNMIKTNNIFK
ncbi:methionyl-tRNA formyltransferase [endosymbiont of Sipalinus gigas]|uniref:methionyl-tRNA formyltransferase n=1 Tax=endosymbiont of Sipalinus gigas TaxID=1972134 RepID=UPI000DC6F27F|nr:formyltransferase family protein [endosymbiont of Sipalinus gigas]BBA85238.1 methionyl-tRNA formyltransferase [endosymbiont of Sipalinus gigas]